MAKIDQTVKSTLTSDLIARPEYLGWTSLMQPFAQACASQRSTMYSAHLTQSLVLDGSEQPRIMTGYENIIGKYEFSTSRIDQDIVVRKCLPKFNPMNYREKAGLEIPSWCIVYVGNKDGMVHCMDISTYTLLHDGFGYFNKILGFENDMLYEGSLITKGTKLTTSPSHEGNQYKMGMNANVAFMGEWGDTEDAFVISKSLAAKGKNTAIQQVKLNIGLDTMPLDLYGQGGNYKCFPGIGETVREDGALIALRRINKSTYVQDMTPSSLRQIEHLHDEVHRAPPGSKVIDVDVYINWDAAKKLKDGHNYQQFFDLDQCHRWQQDAIIQAYEQLCIKEGLPCAPEFNTRFVREATLSANKKYVKKHTRLYDAREPIEFITVVITYAYKRSVTPGSKLTGREGGKGVISAIWEDEDMPVDDNGIRADIIMTPASIINRMNPSQLFEQYWNRVAVQVIRNVKDMYLGGWKATEGVEKNWMEEAGFKSNWRKIYAYILEFFNDFRPAYAQFVNEQLTALEKKTGNAERMLWTEGCLNNGLYLIHSFRQLPPSEHLIKVAEKYGVKATPVTYKVVNQDTGEKTVVRTKKPVFIGSKYLMLLGKIPSAALASIEVGYVSQFELPIKPKSKHVKSQSIIGQTPQKLGICHKICG